MSLVAEGPAIQVCGRVGSAAAFEGLGYRGDDLVGDAHHADVVVGDEGQQAAALAGPAVEDDRSGLGDRERAPLITDSTASSRRGVDRRCR